MSSDRNSERARTQYKPRFHRLAYRRRKSEIELERTLDQFRATGLEVWQDSQLPDDSACGVGRA